MTLLSQDNLAATDYCMLIKFEWGSSTARYTTWTDDVTTTEGTYTSDPTLHIASGDLGGGSQDRPFIVMMDSSLSPNDELITLGPHAPVVVTIYECVPSDANATVRTIWKGRIGKKTKNPGGRRNLIKLEVHGLKQVLNVSLGIVCTTTCVWRFGDDQCGLTPNTETGNITLNHDSKSNRIDVSWDSGGVDESEDLWRRGHVEYDGLRIMIRKSNEDGSFDLAQIPPSTWEGQNVTLTEGCDGLLTTCQLRSNESQFAGLGYGMPARNPQFEIDE